MGQPLYLPNNTLLVIEAVSGSNAMTLTPYAARGLTQTLEPITGLGAGGAALGTWLRRDLRANLLDLSNPILRKYESVISCRDTETPCLDGAWIGLEVLVSCVVELNYLTGMTPQRTPVAGSSRSEGTFTFYRPQLQMRVASIKNNFQEYQAAYAWQIQLAEM